MKSGAFSDTVLRNFTVCALTSSRLDSFSVFVSYTSCNDNKIFWKEAGNFFGGNLPPLKYPR